MGTANDTVKHYHARNLVLIQERQDLSKNGIICAQVVIGPMPGLERLHLGLLGRWQNANDNLRRAGCIGAIVGNGRQGIAGLTPGALLSQ